MNVLPVALQVEIYSVFIYIQTQCYVEQIYVSTNYLDTLTVAASRYAYIFGCPPCIKLIQKGLSNDVEIANHIGPSTIYY